jgi:diguanylate cyclase (GGDEF)-like protein
LARVRLYSGTLADASLRDPLTGLFNRRALGASASVLFRDSMRAGQPVSVLMLDIDHFKMVNDLHGHPAGDSVLRQFAELLLASARTSDTAARYGGEEFVVVLPGSPLAPALRLAERIRETTENTIFTHGKLKLNLTVSIGAATAFPGEMASFDALVENADRNLYRAKREGRNRVLANPIIAEAETD